MAFSVWCFGLLLLLPICIQFGYSTRLQPINNCRVALDDGSEVDLKSLDRPNSPL